MKKKMIPLISSQIPDYLNQGDVSIVDNEKV